MKVLVAGAGGYIGARVLTRFRARAGVSAHGVGRGIGDSPNVDLAEDRKAVRHVIGAFRPDVIVNAAGTISADMDACIAAHIAVTANLLTAATELAPGARFLQLGSAAEYGNAVSEPDAINEETLPRPQGAYGISKLAATLLATREGPARGLHAIALRIFNLVGPGMTPGTIIPNVLRFLASPGRKPTDVFEAGALDIYRDFVDIEDVLDAIVTAATIPATDLPNGSIINLASGQIARVRDVVRQLLDAAGHVGEIHEHVQVAARSTGVRWALGDNRRAREYLGWQARQPLATSLRELVTPRD